MLRHRIRKYPDSPIHSHPHIIGFVADLFCFTLESGFQNIRTRCRIRRMRVDGSRIRKEKVGDSEISGYVWTGPKSLEKQKLFFLPSPGNKLFRESI